MVEGTLPVHEELLHKTKLPNFILLSKLLAGGGTKRAAYFQNLIYSLQGNDHSYIDIKQNQMLDFHNMISEKCFPHPFL